MDSLRYWVTEMHVDGFRFDLASALARACTTSISASGVLRRAPQDPVLSQVKLIAEPWDLGAGGYQVGNFPPLWTEWNGRYRDTVRDFWRGDAGGVRELAYRLSGSAICTRTTAAGRTPRSTSSPPTTASRCATSSTLRRQAQRGQRRGQPRRRRRQPLVELRRRGRDRRRRRSTRCGPAGAEPDGHAAAVAPACRCSRGRRARPHPGRQQQRLLPGQRTVSWLSWNATATPAKCMGWCGGW